VDNFLSNFGEAQFRGLDIGASYRWEMLGGRFFANFQGNRLLKQEVTPLPGINDAATYDCAGKVNAQCQAPKWRHIASLRYSRDWFTANLRWRYFGKMDYVDAVTGAPLTTDAILVANGGKVSAYNYIDLSASALIGSLGELTVGVNNIADKEPPMVGGSLGPANGNALGGYDQAGRFIFTNFTVKF
jgi:outer membrane receptor protein involved in Fe transport